MTKAYSYIRFSTPEQLKGDSLRRQVSLSEAYAIAHNLDLDRSLNLRDLGISAYDQSNLSKGALGLFLGLIKEGKVERGSYLLIESLDRLSRAELLDALELFLGILKAGITIVTLIDNNVYNIESINNNFTNLIASIVIMSRASDESETKSKRIRAAWDSKRNNISNRRLTARCPYWLKPTKNQIGFEIIEDRAQVVREIFQMAKEGLGNFTITKKLNQENVPTFSSKTDGWRESYIQKLLKNKAAFGQFQPQLQRNGSITKYGEPIDNYYPAVITQEEWLLVNSYRENRRSRGSTLRGKNVSNLFSGLLKCGYCGGSLQMGAHKRLKDNYTRRYVACSTARRGLGCYFIQWAYDQFENQFLQFCRSIDFESVLGKKTHLNNQIEETEKELLLCEETINESQAKLKNLIKLIEDGALNSSSVVARISELENLIAIKNDAKEMLTSQLNALRTDESITVDQKKTIIEILEQLTTLDGDELKDIRTKLAFQIKRVVRFIALYPGGNLISKSKKTVLEEALQSKAGFSSERTQQYLESMEKPNKEERFFTVVFNNNEFLRVSKYGISDNLNDRHIEQFWQNTFG